MELNRIPSLRFINPKLSYLLVCFYLVSDQWKKMVEEEREWFLKDEWMADKSKRFGKSIVQPEMKGSFRTLSID